MKSIRVRLRGASPGTTVLGVLLQATAEVGLVVGMRATSWADSEHKDVEQLFVHLQPPHIRHTGIGRQRTAVKPSGNDALARSLSASSIGLTASTLVVPSQEAASRSQADTAATASSVAVAVASSSSSAVAAAASSSSAAAASAAASVALSLSSSASSSLSAAAHHQCHHHHHHQQ